VPAALGKNLQVVEKFRLFKSSQIVAPAESPAEAWHPQGINSATPHKAAFEDGGEMAGFSCAETSFSTTC